MEINYYRQDNAQGYEEAWSSCQFTSDTDLSQFSVKPLVSINGQPYLRQHHVTYLTVRDVTTVRHISGYDLHVLPDQSQFQFTIGPDNLPQEATPTGKTAPSGIDDDTLRTIVNDIIQPGQDITATDLLAQVKARHSQLKRDTRDAALLDQIHRLHLLDPIPIPSSYDSKEVNESKAGTSKLSHEINNSLTLPTHPQSVAACPVGGGSAAVIPSGNQPCHAHANPCND